MKIIEIANARVKFGKHPLEKNLKVYTGERVKLRWRQEAQFLLPLWIPVIENGRRRRISKLQAAAKQVANKGAAGDLRATKMAFDLAEKAEQQLAATQSSNDRLSASDEDIVERLMGRLRLIIKEEEIGPPDASGA